MATAKKPAKSTAKKTAATRAPAKAAPKTKVVHKAAPKHQEMRSFRKAEAAPFLSFQITKQTLYWLILSGIILILGIWVLSISMQVQEIYDQIDATNQATSILP